MECLPTPTPPCHLLSAPPLLENVWSPRFQLFKFKLLLPLDAEHLLEQVTLWILDLHFLIVEAPGQWRSVPQPAGMASEGGKLAGWGAAVLETALTLKI